MSPRATRRPAKRAAASRGAAKRKAAAKPRRKAAAKPKRRAVAKPKRKAVAKPKRKAAAKPKRKAAAKPKRKAAAKPKRKAAAKPKRKAVAKPKRPAAAAPAFAAQRASASAKQQVLFDLERGRVAVHAAIQGLTAARASQPIGPGRWTPHQIVLHLVFWDHFVLNALPFALNQNESPDWNAMDFDAVNAQGLELHAGADWDEARRRLDATREQLRAALEAIPAEPATVWTREHAVGRLILEFGIEQHDRHHAGQIKAFRTTRGA